MRFIPYRMTTGNSHLDSTFGEILTDEQLRIVHDGLPAPVGRGKVEQAQVRVLTAPDDISAKTHMITILMSIGGRIERGAIPLRLEDLRCSYCFMCHESTPMRCSRCHKVFYCNRECQKKHWTFHKQVCGTVSEQWDLDG